MKLLFLHLLLLGAVWITASCNQMGGSTLTCSEIHGNFKTIFNNYKQKNELNRLKLEVRKTLKRSPRCKDAYVMIADIDFTLNDINDAFLDYKKGLAFGADSVYAYFMCGLTSELMANYDSAVVYYARAASEKSKSEFIVNETEDVKKLEPGKSYDIAYEKIRLRKGIASYFKRDLRQSIRDLNYCIKNRYMLSEAFLYRGFCLLDIDSLQSGCEDLKSAKLYGNKSADEYIRKYCDKISAN